MAAQVFRQTPRKPGTERAVLYAERLTCHRAKVWNQAITHSEAVGEPGSRHPQPAPAGLYLFCEQRLPGQTRGNQPRPGLHQGSPRCGCIRQQLCSFVSLKDRTVLSIPVHRASSKMAGLLFRAEPGRGVYQSQYHRPGEQRHRI